VHVHVHVRVCVLAYWSRHWNCVYFSLGGDIPVKDKTLKDL